MIKKKATLADTIKKAATAYSAFRPRPGGAAERLKAAQEKSALEKAGPEPDGITGVVPAPLRGTTKDVAPGSEQNETAPKQDIPTVSVLDASGRPLKEKVDLATPAQDAPPKTPSPSGERKRQRREANMTKYSNALGIDPSLLQDRGGDFDDILTDLGWDGKLPEDKRIEDFEADIRREIGRVQAKSWLGHLELQEGKVDQLAKLIDKTIEECDELDGLLTLYSHELNVSFLFSQRHKKSWETNSEGTRHYRTTLRILKRNLRVSKFRRQIKSFSRTSCKAF
jgi:hypothetical protein